MKIASIICSVFIISMFFTSTAQAAVGLTDKFRPKNLPTLSDDAKGNVETARKEFTQRVVNVIFGLAGTVALYFFISNAWWLIASGGSEEKVTQYKKGLMWALIGIVLILLSYSIIRFVISIPFTAHEGEFSGTAAGSSSPLSPP